ncbi:hypothetical protein DM01DRAFT_1314722 [Hesseltinella vesiculosa]|uniref:protein-tyrosine-phosphatase n=1 Tax=Hesseltinella vesiculosa TaxID=101127 RepID=A0A1X2GY91_9FUNG|nr:hypothetical protein DM01DRAFT_1314722 [Hesseltinella vesiculosa]
MLFDRYKKSKRPAKTGGGKKVTSLSESFFRKLPYSFGRRPWSNKQATSTAMNEEPIPRHSTSLPNIRAEAKRQRTTRPRSPSFRPDPALLFDTSRKVDKRHSTIHPHLLSRTSPSPTRSSRKSKHRHHLTCAGNSHRNSYTFGDPSYQDLPLIQDLRLDADHEKKLDLYLARKKAEASSALDHHPPNPPSLTMPTLTRAQSIDTSFSPPFSTPLDLIQPDHLLDLLAQPHLPLVLIDVRSLIDYQQCRVRGSINVNLPSLLVKRYQRGAIANFHLENFITTAEGRDHYLVQRQSSTSSMSSITTLSTSSSSSNSSLSSSPTSFGSPMTPTDEPASIATTWVVYDDTMEQDRKASPAWTLLNVLSKASNDATADRHYFLAGGFQGFLRHLDMVYRQVENTSSIPDCLEGMDPVSYLSAVAVGAHPAPSLAPPPSLFLPPTSSTSTPSLMSPPSSHHTRQRRPVNLAITTTPLTNPVKNSPNHQQRHSLYGGPCPRRSQSYSAGSKPLQHTSLFSLDTQAARENNANALARRASRRSQQLQWQQQQQLQSTIALDDPTTHPNPPAIPTSTGTPVLSSACSTSPCTWFTASASPASSSSLTPIALNMPITSPTTVAPAAFGPVSPATKILGRLMEEDDSISPQTEGDFDFTISEIIPGFLYVGPEIETPDQAHQLLARPIRRVLNMAEECQDLALLPFIHNNRLDYRKISARDTVEMQNIDHIILEGVAFIEDAKRHHQGIYVHCKAGKSRSVTVILAYLVACERWTLKQSYGHVIKARPNMSPNIGFMAELMKLENQVHGSVSSFMQTDWNAIASSSIPTQDLLQLQMDWENSPSSPTRPSLPRPKPIV